MGRQEHRDAFCRHFDAFCRHCKETYAEYDPQTPPWPDLDEGVGFTPIRGLDLYRQPDPFRIPHRSEFTSREDWTEFAIMCSAGFGEPLAYSLRARQLLAERRDWVCWGSTGLALKAAGIHIAKGVLGLPR